MLIEGTLGVGFVDEVGAMLLLLVIGRFTVGLLDVDDGLLLVVEGRLTVGLLDVADEAWLLVTEGDVGDWLGRSVLPGIRLLPTGKRLFVEVTGAKAEVTEELSAHGTTCSEESGSCAVSVCDAFPDREETDVFSATGEETG